MKKDGRADIKKEKEVCVCKYCGREDLSEGVCFFCLELMDTFAGQALTGMLSNPKMINEGDCSPMLTMERDAYIYARAMMEERARLYKEILGGE